MSLRCTSDKTTVRGAMPTLAWACDQRLDTAATHAHASVGMAPRPSPRLSRRIPATDAHRPSRNSQARALVRGRARGFTLLEVLLTMILSAALLGILWGLFSVYLRLFETGQAKAEQQQLVRALMQQLTDDLHSALEDSPAKGANGVSAGVRRFGLLGSRDALRFDVLQVIPLEETPHLETDVSQTLVGSAATPQVPELRTIYYTFADPNDGGANRLDAAGKAVDEAVDQAAETDRDAKPGLTRRELDYETPFGERQAAVSGGLSPTGIAPGSTGVTYVVPTESAAAEPAAGESLEPEVEDDSVIWVPEVVQLEFRYFDGKAWSSEWDSLQRKSLPVAVEVAMRLRPYEEPRQDLAAAAVASSVSPLGAGDSSDEENVLGSEALLGDDTESSAEGVVYDVLQPKASQNPIHRLVIDVPSSRLHPTVQSAQGASSLQPLRATAPLSVSPLEPPAAPSLAPLSVPSLLARPLIRPLTPRRRSASVSRADQWMRAER